MLPFNVFPWLEMFCGTRWVMAMVLSAPIEIVNSILIALRAQKNQFELYKIHWNVYYFFFREFFVHAIIHLPIQFVRKLFWNIVLIQWQLQSPSLCNKFDFISKEKLTFATIHFNLLTWNILLVMFFFLCSIQIKIFMNDARRLVRIQKLLAITPMRRLIEP